MSIDAEKLLLESLNWRYAVKKFDSSKKINENTWRVLEDALALTASSYGAMPFKFIVVTTQELKDKLTEASYKQKQVSDCSHHVVFLAKEKMDEDHIQKYIERTSEIRNVPLSDLDGFKTMMIDNLVNRPSGEESLKWASNQAYIALGNFLTSAALLGVDTCPFEGINKKKYNEILGLVGTGWTTVCACPTGYRASDDKYEQAKKVRFKNEELILHK